MQNKKKKKPISRRRTRRRRRRSWNVFEIISKLKKFMNEYENVNVIVDRFAANVAVVVGLLPIHLFQKFCFFLFFFSFIF